MKQVIFGGLYNLLPIDTTEYNWVVGGGYWGATESRKEQLVSTGGKLKNLRVKLNDVPGTGTYVFTLRLNGAPTTLTCTVAADGTLASDTTHEVAVTGGDRISLECFPDSPDNARYARWTIMFEGTTAKESLIPGASDNFLDNINIDYAQPMGAFDFSWGHEYEVKEVCPTAGKIKDLYVELSEDPGTAPNAYRFTLRVNGEDKALTVTITADDTKGNNTVDEVVVAAGDILTLMCEPLETPSARPYAIWGMTFVADTDGESLILGVSKDDFSSSNKEYYNPQCVSDGAWTGTEAEAYQLAQACTFKKLYIALEVSTGNTRRIDFKSRVNGGDGNLFVTIVSPATTGNDAVNSDVISNDDDVDLLSHPRTLPCDNGKVYWGLVGYIAAAPPVEEPKHTFRLDPRPHKRMRFHPNLKLG